MKKFIVLIVFNIVLILICFYIINFSNSDVMVSYMPLLVNKDIDECIELLSNYEVNIEYVDSDIEKNKVVSTEPESNSLIYEHQMITLYVSSGNNPLKYRNLENELYSDVSQYINEISELYNLKINIIYKEDKYLLDGLIYQQNTDDDYIDVGDILEFIVILNKKTIELPSFIGWHFNEIIDYANKNSLKIEFEYVIIPYKEDYAVGQSVASGTIVLKNSNPIIIYLSKENN